MMMDSEIERLIIGYLCGELNGKEEEELQKWITAGEKNRQFFSKICHDRILRKKWQQRGKINVRAAIAKFEKRIGKQDRWKKRWLVYGQVAAVMALIIGSVVFLWQGDGREKMPALSGRIVSGTSKAILLLNNGQQIVLGQQDSMLKISGGKVNIINRQAQLIYEQGHAVPEEYHELSVPRGGEYRITLSDGTRVYLNSGSVLRYPVAFCEDKREVSFTGEAYFEVSRDSLRPFYVVVGQMKLRVYGTVFNINTHFQHQIRTVLVAGKVGLSMEGGEKVVMKPSQLADLDTDAGRFVVKQVDVTPYVAWTKGLLAFEKERLEQIMNTLSLWYDVEVFFQNQELKDLHFTGVVKRYDDIEEILKALRRAVNAEFRLNGRTLVISK